MIRTATVIGMMMMRIIACVRACVQPTMHDTLCPALCTLHCLLYPRHPCSLHARIGPLPPMLPTS